jgi:hypothetical protein
MIKIGRNLSEPIVSGSSHKEEGILCRAPITMRGHDTDWNPVALQTAVLPRLLLEKTIVAYFRTKIQPRISRKCRKSYR